MARKSGAEPDAKVGDIGDLLEEMADLAVLLESEFVLCVDELHDVSQAEIRALAGGLQQVVEGSPYMLQLVGYHSWAASQTPDAPVALDDVVAGVAQAQDLYRSKVADPTWNDLSAVEQAIVERVVAHPHEDDAVVVAADVGASLAITERTARDVVRRMLTFGLLEADGEGRLALMSGAGLPSYMLADLMAHTAATRGGDGAKRDELGAFIGVGRSSRTSRPRNTMPLCNVWMPRARTRCALAKGHGGKHRSKPPRRPTLSRGARTSE